MNFRNKVFQ